MSRRLLSLHRVPWGGSPASSVLWSLSDFLPTVRPGSVALRLTVPPARPPPFALAAGGAAPTQARIFGQPGPSPALTSAEMAGSPRFLQEPLWTYAVLSDPGRAPGARPFRRGNAVAPVTPRGRPRRRVSFEALSHGLRPRCLRFADALTQRPRKTRFRLVANLYRAGFGPAGLHDERFPLCGQSTTSLPPFPGLAWRTGFPPWANRTSPQGRERSS